MAIPCAGAALALPGNSKRHAARIEIGAFNVDGVWL
jgi:hypothetical protein